MLEIAIDATKEEIVSAYRRWARLVHPGSSIQNDFFFAQKSSFFVCLFFLLDKNSAHQAEEAMKKVTQAKEILTDPAERRRYDQSFMHEEQEPEQPNQNMQDEGDELFNIDRDEERNWWDTQVAGRWLIAFNSILNLLSPKIVFKFCNFLVQNIPFGMFARDPIAVDAWNSEPDATAPSLQSDATCVSFIQT